jgi:hypothetical protein
MSLHTGIGFSSLRSPEDAAKDAAFEAKKNLKQDYIDIALVFTTIHYDPSRILPVIKKVLNNAPLLGCSSAGTITSAQTSSRGILVICLQSPDVQFGMGGIDQINSLDSRQAGKNFAQNCLNAAPPHGRQSLLFFVDSRIKNNSTFIRGIQESLGLAFPITGGGSADDFRFSHGFQIMNNQIFANAAVGLIISGNVQVGIGQRHGWRPLGKPRFIEHCEDNIIKSISGQQPAFLYHEFFGDHAKELTYDGLSSMTLLYPLGILEEESRQYILRHATNLLPDGSIVCQGDVQQGAEVHLMIGNKETCQQAAVEAAVDAKNELHGKEAQLVIIIESLSRLKLLGRDHLQEIKKIREVFGPNVPIAGMFSNGQIGPSLSNDNFKKPVYQNESIVILALA